MSAYIEVVSEMMMSRRELSPAEPWRRSFSCSDLRFLEWV